MSFARCERLLLLAWCLPAAQLLPTNGRVLDWITGRGIPGVRVTVVGNEAEQTLTDSQGNFELADWHRGFSYHKEGYRELSNMEDVQWQEFRGHEVYVANGVRMWMPVIHLMMPLSTLSLAVVDEKARPIAGTKVSVNPEADPG